MQSNTASATNLGLHWGAFWIRSHCYKRIVLEWGHYSDSERLEIGMLLFGHSLARSLPSHCLLRFPALTHSTPPHCLLRSAALIRSLLAYSLQSSWDSVISLSNFQCSESLFSGITWRNSRRNCGISWDRTRMTEEVFNYFANYGERASFNKYEGKWKLPEELLVWVSGNFCTADTISMKSSCSWKSFEFHCSRHVWVCVGGDKINHHLWNTTVAHWFRAAWNWVAKTGPLTRSWARET